MGGDVRRVGASLGTVPSYSEDPNQPPGVLLSDVVPDGAAAKAGLKGGDRIVQIGTRRDPQRQRPDVRAADREARHRRQGHVRARRQAADGDRDVRRAAQPPLGVAASSTKSSISARAIDSFGAHRR